MKTFSFDCWKQKKKMNIKIIIPLFDIIEQTSVLLVLFIHIHVHCHNSQLWTENSTFDQYENIVKLYRDNVC